MNAHLCSINDMRRLDVINLCNGKKLGFVEDLEIDLCNGNITAILVPKKKRFRECFFTDNDRCYRIPWCKIERIGKDTILVCLEEGQ